MKHLFNHQQFAPSWVRMISTLACAATLCSAANATTYYVSTTGSDSNNGTSLSSPFKTINKAMGKIEGNNAVSQADTVYIRGGIYRERVSVTVGANGTSTQHTLISAYNGEQPVIDGSDIVTGWMLDSGNVWKVTGWTQKTSQVMVDWSLTNDVAPLTQIGSYGGSDATDRAIYGSGRSSMTSGSFYHDATNNILYVWLPDGSDPNNHQMTVSTRANCLFQSGTPNSTGGYDYGSNIDWVGLSFRHSDSYATFSYADFAAVVTMNNQQLINCNVQWADQEGIYLNGNSVTTGMIASNNGLLGINCSGTGWTVSGGRLAYNDYRHFNLGSEAGIKAISNSTIYGTVHNVEVDHNYGNGIWFDTTRQPSVQSPIDSNYVHDNQGIGIFIEAADNCLVSNNVVMNNHVSGISVNSSQYDDLYNNTIAYNYGIAGIELDGDRSGNTLDYTDVKNNIFFDNFATYDITVPLYTSVNRTEVSTGKVFTIDFNLYWRRGGPIQLGYGGRYEGYFYPIVNGLSTWSTKTGFDTHSISADPLFQSLSLDNWPLGSNSPAIDTGLTLSLVPYDYFGTTRPQGAGYDMGVYEFVSGLTGTPDSPPATDPFAWIDDAFQTTPTGVGISGDYTENKVLWVTSNPTPVSGASCLLSNNVLGQHGCKFTSTTAMTNGTTTLFASVWLDPSSTPSEIMFQWYGGGSWNHRAYWGQNLIALGTDGTASRLYIGGLPATGQWVKLAIPASLVGLSNQAVTGFQFTLYNGDAALDDVGAYGIAPKPTITPPSGLYNDLVNVSISDTAPSATIYYTTDGTTPTISSSIYTTPIAIMANANVQAFAVAPQFTDSMVASAAYTITYSAPTVATPASASPSPVTGKTTTCSVLGAYAEGENTLTYTWSATGPAAVAFTLNGTNAAKSSVATFAATGSYTLTATITNTHNLSTTSSVNITVNQTPAKVYISPSPGSVVANHLLQMYAEAMDQFGALISPTPSTVWRVTSGGGMINTSGTYTAPTTSGSATVKAIIGTLKASSSITITADSSGSGGMLSGTATVPGPTAINLTSEGTTDWAHWGRGVPGMDHKATGGSRVSAFATVGTGTYLTTISDPRGVSWTDGTPTTTSTANRAGVKVTGTGSGFSLTVPAGTALQSVTLYVGGNGAGGKLTAHLSDSSASDFVNVQPTVTGYWDAQYTLTYAAALSNQTLTMVWTNNSGTGEVSLSAVTLH